MRGERSDRQLSVAGTLSRMPSCHSSIVFLLQAIEVNICEQRRLERSEHLNTALTRGEIHADESLEEEGRQCASSSVRRTDGMRNGGSFHI